LPGTFVLGKRLGFGWCDLGRHWQAWPRLHRPLSRYAASRRLHWRRRS
jgi:hypothetical protein